MTANDEPPPPIDGGSGTYGFRDLFVSLKTIARRPVFWACILLGGVIVALALYARSIGNDLDVAQAELQTERSRSSVLQLDVNRACEQHLRAIRAVNIVLTDAAWPEVDAATKRDLGLIVESEGWFVSCKEEYAEMMKFLYGTPEQRQQQLDALADEAEQDRLRRENKRFWIIQDGKKIWIDPDPVPMDAREP